MIFPHQSISGGSQNLINHRWHRRLFLVIIKIGIMAMWSGVSLQPARAQDIPPEGDFRPVYWRAAQAMGEGDYLTARRLLSTMLIGRNFYANAYWRLAQCYAFEGRSAAGEAFFQNLLKQGAPAGEVYGSLAILAKLQDDRRRTAEYCWLAVQNQTSLLWIHEMLVDLAPVYGFEQQVHEHLATRVAKNPEDWLAQYTLAYWETVRGRPESAASQFAMLVTTGHESWRIYFRWAIQLMMRGKLDSVRVVTTQGLAACQERDDLEGEGQILHLQAHLHLREGNLDLADSLLNRCEQLSRAIGYLDLRANLETTRSGLALRRGQLQKALAYAKSAQELSGRLRDQYALMVASHYAADAYRYMGLYELALQEWTQAYQLADSLKNETNRQLMAHNLAIVYQLLGDNQRALPYFEEAIVYARKQRQMLYLTHYLHNCANSLADLNRLDEAKRYYDEALFLARQNDLEQEQYNIFLNLVLFWQKYENWRMAERTASDALQFASRTKFNIGVIKALLRLAEAEYHIHKLDQAEKHFHAAQRLRADAGFYAFLIESMTGLGKIVTIKGDNQKALSILAAAADLVSQRVFSESAGTTSLLLPIEKELFFALSRAYVHIQRPQQAFELAEQMRDLIVRRRLQRVTMVIHESIADSLRWQIAHLDTLLLQKRLQLANILPSDTTSSHKMKLRLEIASLELQQNQLWEKIGGTIGKSLQGHSTLTLTAAQKELRERGELALIYQVGEEETLIFALNGDTLLAQELQFGKEKLRDLVREVNPALHYALNDSLHLQLVSPLLFRYNPTAAWQLYQLLMAPFANYAAARKLLIIPDEYLHFLPFEILLREALADTTVKDYRQMPFVLRDYTVRYASSLQAAFDEQQSQLQTPATIFALAQTPLQFDGTKDGSLDLWQTHAEVKAIQNILGASAVTITTGPYSINHNWRHELAQYQILHFAAHSEAQNAEPLSSRIILDEGNKNPLSLYAFEIFAMHLPNGRLAFLSSCNTASGVLRGSEGLQGLVQSFRAAGIPSVIGTLWPTEAAASSKLAAEFYRGLQAGKPASEALRQAKLSLLQNNNANPFYWAAFQYYGVDQEFRFRQDLPFTPFLVVLVLAVVIGAARGFGFRLRLYKNHDVK